MTGMCNVCELAPRERGAVCVTCSRARQRKYAADSQAKLRERVREYKLSAGCIDCGFNRHPDALQFDHLPQFPKTGNISEMRSWALIEMEIAKCEVVCANCHAIRTAQRRRA